MDNIKTQKTERIDVVSSLKEMSNNIPGHKARMKVHCERVQREYLDLRDINGRFKRQT